MFSFKTKMNMLTAFLTKNRPFYIQYYILSRCNLNCRMCNIVEGNSDLKEADLETVKKIAANLRKIGAGVVLLTGGEPFLRKDLPDIVKIFMAEGLNPRLQTAGYRTTREQLEACAKAGAKDINISLDSLIPEKQDYINGSIPGSWKKAVETIVIANEVFSDPDRICAFGTVLSRFNYMEIPALAELANFLGWFQSLVPVHITTTHQPLNFRGVDKDFQFVFPEDDAKLDALKRKLLEMKKSGINIFDSEAYLNSTFYFLKHNRPNWRKNDVCDSPHLYFAILPNGDFAVCCDWRFPGKISVADPRFPEIYGSKKFRREVHGIAAACSGCNYGSYPEVTLSVRDFKATLARAKTVLFQKAAKVPKRTLPETMEFIAHLREKYGIPPYTGPVFKVKPAASSQRYGDPQTVFRGPQSIPQKFQLEDQKIDPETSGS